MTVSPIPQSFLGPLEFLVCGLPGQQKTEQLFLMMVAHIDDSGSEGNGRCFYLAGFLARAEVWHLFSDSWKTVLNESPRIEYFKAKEAYRCKGQFDGFSREQRDEKVARLHSVIEVHKRDLHGVASVLWWKDFNEFNSLFENPIHPYFVLFFKVIWATIQIIKQRFPDERVELVFDDQGTLGTRAGAVADWAFESLSESTRRVFHGRPVHRSDKIVIPLQAADMLAWHLRRGSEDDTGFSRFPEAFGGIPLAYERLDRPELSKLAANALEIQERFPHIRMLYRPEELREIRNRFLGYDPDYEIIGERSMARPEMIEGPEAARQFDRVVRTILSVSRAEMERREAEYRTKAEANPNRRGPKRKPKPSASPDPAA